MSVRFTCSCGKSLKVPDNYAGRKVKCPGCRQSVPVPEPAPAPAPVPPGVLQFACACGQLMQAREEHAGQATKCPACGSAVTIPTSTNAPAAPDPMGFANNPPPGPAPAQQDEDWDTSEPSRRKGSFLTMMLGCATLFLFAGVGVGLFFFFMGGVPTDLAYVPDDAVMFVSIRVADIWENETAKEALEEPTKTPIEERLEAYGLAPTDVERMTFVSRDPRNMDIEWVIVATKSAYDKTKLIETMELDSEAVSYRGKNYYKKSDSPKDALFPVSEDVFLVASEASIKASIDTKPRSRMSGPLRPALKLAAAGHHFVAGVAPKKIPQAGAENAFPIGDDTINVEWARQLTSALIVADFDSPWKVRASLHFDSAETAGIAEGSLDKALSLLKTLASEIPDEQVKTQTDKILDNLQVEQSGNAVHVKTEFEANDDGIKALFPLLK